MVKQASNTVSKSTLSEGERVQWEHETETWYKFCDLRIVLRGCRHSGRSNAELAHGIDVGSYWLGVPVG